jgi:hypothetical protein
VLPQARRWNFPSLDLMKAIREEVDILIPGGGAVKRGSPELFQIFESQFAKSGCTRRCTPTACASHPFIAINRRRAFLSFTER